VNQRNAAIGIQTEKEKELKIRCQALISMQNTVLDELEVRSSILLSFARL